MMRRYSLTPRRLMFAIAAIFVASLAVATASAQAVVIQDNQGHAYGVGLAPGSGGLGGTGFSAEQAGVGAACNDPGLAADFGSSLPTNGGYLQGLTAGPLCLQDSSTAAGPTVLQKSELLSFTWDPKLRYWQRTLGYVEQFLRDVAGGAGTLTSPFADVTQYTDVLHDRASTPSVYGGGCVDHGVTGGYTCQFGNTNGSGTGSDYPANDPTKNCTATGSNDICITDAAIQQEVSLLMAANQVHIQRGYTPLVEMLIPNGVEVCLDHAGGVCSVTSAASATFCSYHSQVNGVPYVVLPWTIYTSCDETKFPALPNNPTPEQISTDAGQRLVSPLSGGTIAATVNPFLNGWFENDGTEIDDPCGPGDQNVDKVVVGSNSYSLERELNNAAALAYDPFTYGGCAPAVLLEPSFVVPSAVNAGDTVQLDGAATPSTLLVPKDNYMWDFGDGSSQAKGPSVEHQYTKAGNYNVKLTVTDRGNNSATIVQTVQVLGPAGQPYVPQPPSTPVTGNTGGGSAINGLNVHLQMLPQSLKSVLRSGISVRVTSNKPANGIATVTISRSAAKRAHIKVGSGPVVRIGLGTVSAITNGTVTLHLHLSPAVAKKLAHLRHVDMTVRLALVAAGSQRLAIDAAGRY